MSSISVITSVRNEEKYLAKTIESVLNQTFKDFKYYIYDDCSTDKSLDIALHYAKLDKRLIVVKGGVPSVGIGEVFAYIINKYIKGKSKYMGVVDGDDLLHKNCLLDTYNKLESNPNAGVCYTLAYNIDENGDITNIDKRALLNFDKNKFLLSFIPFHFRLIRLEEYNKVEGYSVDMDLAEDFDLCLQLSEITDFVKVNTPLYFYRRHANNMSSCRQFEMIAFVMKAVDRALVRRKLDKTYKVSTQIDYKLLLQNIND